MKDERKKLQTFIADGWTGESRSFTNGVSKWARTAPTRTSTARTKVSWMARAGEGEGDKGSKEFWPGWRHQPGPKPTLLSLLDLLSRLVAPTGTKGCCHPPNPSGLASHWALDKSHLWSRAQRQAGQMAWTKGLFCSSVSSINQTIMTRNCTLTEVNQVW